LLHPPSLTMSEVCEIGFQPEGKKIAKIPFGGKTFPLAFKSTIPALKDTIGGTIIKVPSYITAKSLQTYFVARKALNDGAQPENTITFEVAKVAELMCDVDFFNRVKLSHYDIPLDTVTYDQLGPLTATLCLGFLLEKCKAEVAIESGYERTREAMPSTLIPVKLQTKCQKGIPKDWTLSPEIPVTRTTYSRWAQRMEKFLACDLGRWFWEHNEKTREFIVTVLQMSPGRCKSAIKKEYAIRRQDQSTGRPIAEVWCHHDKDKKNTKNCDDLDEPCSNCKGILSWVRSNLPSEADEIKAEVEAETWKIWNTNPKYSKTDYDEILLGSEMSDGYMAQLAEVRRIAVSSVTRRRAKKNM